MLRFLFLLMPFLLVFGLMSPAFAESDAEMNNAEFSFNHGSGFQNYKLGKKIIRDQTHDLVLQYNFAQLAGAIGTVNLRQPSTTGNPGGATSGKLPANGIIVGCYVDVLTAPTSGGSATIALSSGQSAADLMAATAYSSFTGIMACIPTGSAATSIKLTADQTPTLTIATAALTAGKINVHIEYVLSDP